MNAVVLARRVATPAIVGTALALVVGAGIAAASYRALVASTGTGSATTSSTSTVTLSVTGAVSTGLYPGGPGADLTVSVTNPYAASITVKSIAINGTIGVSGASGSCTTTGLAIGTPGGLPATVATGTHALTLTSVVTMGLGADTGCQGASFTIPFQVTGQL